MRTTLLLCLLASAPVAQDEASRTEESEVVVLRDRPLRTFDLVLPGDPWRPVGTSLPIPHAGGPGFAVAPVGTGLRLDTDGDGELERLVEGSYDETTMERTAWVRLEALREDGAPLVYAVRFLDRGEGWHWAPSGVVQGRLGQRLVRVVDLSGNGRYDDYGEDAWIVGSGAVAATLSRAIVLDGRVRSLAVAADGSQLTLGAYEGTTGRVDVTSALDAEAKLLSAVFVRTDDPTIAFELAEAGGGAELPVGTYRLGSGVLGLSEARVQVRTGRSKSIEVRADAAVTLDWGGPVRAEFGYSRRGGEIVFDPAAVWYYGAAGEEYYGWSPRGKSPEFTVKERKVGTELAKAVFQGST